MLTVTQWKFRTFLAVAAAVVLFACKAAETPTVNLGDAASDPVVESSTISVSNVLSSSVFLTWTKATKNGIADPDLTYQVYYSSAEDIATLSDLTANGTAYGDATTDIAGQTVENLADETTYYFNVKVVNSAGNASVYTMTNATTDVASDETDSTDGTTTDGTTTDTSTTSTTSTSTSTTTDTTTGSTAVTTVTTTGSGSVPVNAATAVSFTDTDFTSGEVAGTITITKATSETDVTYYGLYWGSASSTKLSGSTIISYIAATGANVTYTIGSNTALPSGATHLLVFTVNSTGEMATGISTTVTDLSVPATSAGGLSFTDTDATYNEVAGTVTITKAIDESNVTLYNLYWGSSASAVLSGQPIISAIAVTGANVTYTFAANTPKPTGATHLLVYTANSQGESSTPTALAVVDAAPPLNAAQRVCFNDTRSTSQIRGNVTITRAADESDVTSYKLYWGISSTTKKATSPLIATFNTSSAGNVIYTFPTTTIPTGVTHFLVYSNNAYGEMSTNVFMTPINGATTTCP